MADRGPAATGKDQKIPESELLVLCRKALKEADGYLSAARRAVASRIVSGGRLDGERLDTHQFAAHGLAWTATYVEALRQLLAWGERLSAAGGLTEIERLILAAGFAEYLAELAGGIAMSQGEIVRPADLGVDERSQSRLKAPAVARLIAAGNAPEVRLRIAELIAGGDGGRLGLGDETLELIRDQFRRFADERVAPHAHGWHLADALIPLSVITEMAELGVFGLTVPEAHGGLGLGKLAMCIVSEELSRAFLAVGSLGTRSEIAGELIRLAGTPAQKAYWLPRIASGQVLPTAMFTEPDIGSDLGSVRTRAVLTRRPDGSAVYAVHGAKTWSTHGARSDLMTLLVRTDPAAGGYRGLSMLLAPKPRGDDAQPFPANGMSGSEIKVLGYRGMKEYAISFDGFEVAAENLLGGVEGDGFKQLMQTFESARIQTAARAVGVAQNALDLGLKYAQERVQFGKPIVAFPRVAGKLAWMAVETMIARQLTYFAAREKDGDRRCDMEAGMAKLLAARVAWANADNALQVHGGVGYALEYPISRVLCDARILNIFEGAAEIQANVIARALLVRRN